MHVCFPLTEVHLSGIEEWSCLEFNNRRQWETHSNLARKDRLVMVICFFVYRYIYPIVSFYKNFGRYYLEEVRTYITPPAILVSNQWKGRFVGKGWRVVRDFGKLSLFKRSIAWGKYYDDLNTKELSFSRHLKSRFFCMVDRCLSKKSRTQK